MTDDQKIAQLLAAIEELKGALQAVETAAAELTPPPPAAIGAAELLTIDEAAARLRTSPATMRFWRHKGTGPESIKIGRRVMYRTATLDKWLAAQR